MSDANRPSFSFQPASATGSNTSPFGSAPKADQPKSLFGGSSSLFGGGGNTSQTPSTSSSLFGSAATSSTTPTTSSNLFGSAAAASTATPSSTSTLFGGASSNTPTSSASNIFGNKAATTGGFSFGNTTTTSSSSPSLFSNPSNTTTATSNTSNTNTLATTSSLFGARSTTIPTSTAGVGMSDNSSVFANAAKSPATSSGGLFQNLGKTPTDAGTPQQKPPSAFSFTPAGKPPTTTSGNAGTSLFGAQTSTAPLASTGLFGSQASQANATPSTSASLFGAQSSQASGAPSTSASLFGSAKANENQAPSLNLGQGNTGKSLFGEVKPASSNDKPSTPSLFANATPTTQANAATASTPSLFGNILPKQDQNSAITTSSAAPSLFSTAASSAPQSSSAAATSAAAPASALFSALNKDKDATSTPSTTAAAPPSLGGLFGQAQSSAQPATSASTTAAGQTATTSTAGASTNAGLFGASVGNPPNTQPTSTTQQPTSRLASKSLDDIITTWSTSLASHQKTFANVAERVAKWDRQLVQNSSAIGGLYSRVFQAERDTAEVERQLSNVEAGQRELDARLAKYEAEVDSLLNAAGLGDDGTAGGVDNEREQTYNAAEDCQSRLTDMGQNLTAMIEEVNLASNKLSSTKKNNASDDPLAQIVRVLNAHLAQLQVIDKGAQSLTLKVEQAQKDAGVLAGRNGAAGGKDWIDGFGRSYLGRR